MAEPRPPVPPDVGARGRPRREWAARPDWAPDFLERLTGFGDGVHGQRLVHFYREETERLRRRRAAGD